MHEIFHEYWNLYRIPTTQTHFLALHCVKSIRPYFENIIVNGYLSLNVTMKTFVPETAQGQHLSENKCTGFIATFFNLFICYKKQYFAAVLIVLPTSCMSLLKLSFRQFFSRIRQIHSQNISKIYVLNYILLSPCIFLTNSVFLPTNAHTKNHSFVVLSIYIYTPTRVSILGPSSGGQ